MTLRQILSFSFLLAATAVRADPAKPALSLLPPPVVEAASGRIDTAEATVEVLGRTYHRGDVVELPEGYLRVEEDDPEGNRGEVGTFTVLDAVEEPANPPTGVGSGESAAPKHPPAPRADPK